MTVTARRPSPWITLSAVIALCGIASAAPAQHRHQEAHEHGVGHLDVAFDGGNLELQLEGPGENFVGFEHAPATAQEMAAVRVAEQRMRKATALFSLPAAAGCTLRRAAVTPPAAAKTSGVGDEHHDEWAASYAFACKTPTALKELDAAGVFRAFPDTRELQVQVIGPAGQTGLTLTPKASKIPFRRP